MLSRDPLVARRVRILHVYPGFLKEALDKEKGRPTQALRRTFWVKLTELAVLLMEQQKIFIRHPRPRRTEVPNRIGDIVSTILEVLSGLPNVTAYYVTWCGLPSISKTAVPFLSTALHGNLQKLSLELSLENMRSLLTPSFQVDNLKELQLCIHSESVANIEERNRILETHLAPAIRRLRENLQLLHIQSWEPADLAPMLRGVGTLPALAHLIIAIPVEGIHLGDPKGLAEFLSAHRLSLKTLSLRATQYGGKGLEPIVYSFDNWIRNAVDGVALPKLQNLEISTSLFPVDTSLFCLQQFSSRIASIALTGCYRTYSDVEDVLNVIEHRRNPPVTTLRLALVSLSPQLVDMIASKVPYLEKLELAVKYILPHSMDAPQFYSLTKYSYPGQVQEWSQIVSAGFWVHGQSYLTPLLQDDFLSQMEERKYPDWHLRHLSIVAEYLPSRAQYEHFLEQAFITCMPSLKSYS
jgi:hypothetical protein